MLPAANRFSDKKQLSKLMKEGKKVRSKHLLLMYIDLFENTDTKFALGISKKLKQSGVARNRLRRQMYEAIRSLFQTDTNFPVGKGYFVLLLAIPTGKRYHILVSELRELSKQIA